MTDFKQKLRGFFSDSSLFRRIYIIDLFFTNIAFLQIPAYVLLVFLFIWGVCLSVYNQRHNNTFFKLRFGIWIGAFLAVTVFSMLINFSQTFLFSLLMLLHVVMCFFLFYGMHTEPEFDYRIELYHIAKFIIYATTVMNIIGITCLMFGFKFEWYWIKFTVYENNSYLYLELEQAAASIAAMTTAKSRSFFIIERVKIELRTSPVRRGMCRP